MNWIRKRTLRWLLVALLLSSTALMSAQDTDSTTPPKNGHSQISINACLSTCEHTVDQVKTMCNDRSSQTPTWMLSSDTCESDCSEELHNLTHQMETECDHSVTQAVSEERRHYEPIIASLQAKRDAWKKDAERALRELDLWRDVAIGAGVVAVVAVFVGVVL